MSDHTPKDPAKIERQRRLEAQLRANLRRRKSQAKARVGPAPAGGETAVRDEEPSEA